MRHRSQNEYAAEAFEISFGTHIRTASEFLDFRNTSDTRLSLKTGSDPVLKLSRDTLSNNPAISPARGEKWVWTTFEFLSVAASINWYSSGDVADAINLEQVS